MQEPPVPQTPPAAMDAQLVARAGRGDTRAFRQLVETYEKRLTCFACRLLGGDATTAQDVAQDVWIKFWQTLQAGRYEERGQIAAYLFRAVRNRCQDIARASQPTIGLEDAPLIQLAPTPGDGVAHAIGRLPEAQQVTVILHYYDGASYEEIALVLGCAPGTVASRLSAARSTLKRLLTEERNT